MLSKNVNALKNGNKGGAVSLPPSAASRSEAESKIAEGKQPASDEARGRVGVPPAAPGILPGAHEVGRTFHRRKNPDSTSDALRRMRSAAGGTPTLPRTDARKGEAVSLPPCAASRSGAESKIAECKQPAEGCPEGVSEAKATASPQSTPQARKALLSCVILSVGECRKTDAYNDGAPPTLAANHPRSGS